MSQLDTLQNELIQPISFIPRAHHIAYLLGRLDEGVYGDC